MVWNYQNADCSLRKKIIVIYYNFRHTFVPYEEGSGATQKLEVDGKPVWECICPQVENPDFIDFKHFLKFVNFTEF